MIGRGRTGTVYLALHKELEEYRAVKAVAKSSVRYETFRKEALLLKELRHPGIPVIYDIEEDEEYSYLVEEYLQGDSLETLVSSQGPLARCTVLKYAIQICGVVHYLHSAGTEPILHLDLQPKNLLVCHEIIKLIDFGQAAGLTEANEAKMRFGTVGFAAPEQYHCDIKLDERTDIYAIGGLLFYLATGIYPSREVVPVQMGMKMWNREAGRIVAACLEPVKEERYASVSQLEEDLENLLERPVSSQVVAVYGLEPCVGTTHISLALSAYLWKMGIPNLYEECHSSNHARHLAESQGAQMDSYGVFQVFGCVIKPYYGRQVRFLRHQYPVVIQDRGIWGKGGNAQGEETPSIRLIVAGGKWWNRRIACYGNEYGISCRDERYESGKDDGENCGKNERNGMDGRESCRGDCGVGDHTVMLYNFSDKRISLKQPAGGQPELALRVPLFSNPFYPDQKSEEWLEILWDLLERILGEGRNSSQKDKPDGDQDDCRIRKRAGKKRFWRKMQQAARQFLMARTIW